MTPVAGKVILTGPNAGHKRWDDPSFWERVSIGYCASPTHVGDLGHVLKDGLCWHCRPENAR